MKRFKINTKLLGVVCIGLVLFCCERVEYDIPDSSNKVVFGEISIDTVERNSITVNYQIKSIGDNILINHGMACSLDPGMRNRIKEFHSLNGVGEFKITLKSLECNTEYYLAPYVSFKNGLEVLGDAIPVKTEPY